MAEKMVYDEDNVALRRWRNLMIASLSGHKISSQRREHLEQMRKKLGISIEVARQLVDEYRYQGGGITLFGDKHQRLRTFRDIISMLVVDGEIKAKGRELLMRIANKLDVDEQTLDKYIELSKAALENPDGEADSHESQRLSRRVFRRIVSESSERDSLLKQFDSLDRGSRRDLELQVLEGYVHESAGKDEGPGKELERDKRYKTAYLEDQRCAKFFIDQEVVSEQQINPFMEKQQRLYESEGRVISFITDMVKHNALERDLVQSVRKRIRDEHQDEDKVAVWDCKIDGELGGLKVHYSEETLDHTFWAGCFKLEGFLDHSSATSLQESFDELFKQRGDTSRLLIIDMGGLEYISSAGVGVILNARATTLDRWGDIRFVNVSPEAQEIFKLIGVDHVFTFCDNVEDALWSFTDLAVAKDD